MSNAILSESEIGQSFLKALGLNAKRLKKVEVILEAGEAIVIKTEGKVWEEELKDFTTVAKEYELTEKKEEMADTGG